MADETPDVPGRETSWSEGVEARLVALEDKAGITKANEKADTAAKEEKA